MGGVIGPIWRFGLLAVAVLTTSRLLLAWHYSGHIASLARLEDVLGRGWHFDAVVVSAVCVVVVAAQLLVPSRWLIQAWWRRALAGWLSVWLMLIVWNEAATPDFMAEFGVRPNRLFVEYLGTPAEIAGTIWQSHRLALLSGLALTALAGWVCWQLTCVRVSRAPSLPLRLVVLAPLLVACAIGARGSLGHRPLNISFAAVSTDPAVNDLALNSTYTALHALVQMRRERQVIQPYSHLPQAEVLRRVRRAMQLPAAAFAGPAQPTLHRLAPTMSPPFRPNLVILLQESLGAHYFASLGGQPVVQKLESWRNRSLWFDQLYASGTRSARGMEAIATGFPPTRASSVLKLEGAQHDFFTLAAALKARGYRTEFIYGGDSGFDNMRRFLLGNGFDRVLDWSDMRAEAEMTTTWGVSDEDLYARVHRELTAHQQEGGPFFTLVFSVSNHPPYDFPDGRIRLVQQPKRSATNAARYADFAVGSYLETASRSDYWDNSLFMVVADHESRTVGDGLVPVMSFHIPAFIAGGRITPRIVTRVASQIDLVPTSLSLMGIDAVIPATGIDQSRTDLVGPGFAVMQFHDTAAYRYGNDIVVLTPGGPSQQFRLDGLRLLPTSRRSDELRRDAEALTQWPVMAYQAGWYRNAPSGDAVVSGGP